MSSRGLRYGDGSGYPYGDGVPGAELLSTVRVVSVGYIQGRFSYASLWGQEFVRVTMAHGL